MDLCVLAEIVGGNVTMKLPEGTPEYMYEAYVGCLQWAMSKPETLAQFELETGFKAPPPPRTVLDQMIDEATGVNAEWFAKFKTWHDAEIWGNPTAPEKV